MVVHSGDIEAHIAYAFPHQAVRVETNLSLAVGINFCNTAVYHNVYFIFVPHPLDDRMFCRKLVKETLQVPDGIKIEILHYRMPCGITIKDIGNVRLYGYVHNRVVYFYLLVSLFMTAKEGGQHGQHKHILNVGYAFVFSPWQ